MLNSSQFLLHLSLIDKIGPFVAKRLLEKKPENLTFSDFYSLNVLDFQSIFQLSEMAADKIYKGLRNKDLFEKELELIDKYKIGWITLIDDNYPHLLKNIHLPPIVLYFQGSALSDLDKKIAIIGSRKANNYGKNVIDSLVKPLVENKWTIVSGGAIGADTMAHEAALKYGGKTIVVLGSGLLKPHPYSNIKLFKKIIDSQGTIISSYPLMMEALPGNFPARNRIISGISKGCTVVQANIKSGTRITALNALEQGREVFAVPGPIDDVLSSGCHKLIQEGAKLVFSVNDILQEFGETLEENNINFQIPAEKNVNELETMEEKIIDWCKVSCSMDDLIEKSKIDMNELQLKLFELQLQGKIKQNFAGLWESN